MILQRYLVRDILLTTLGISLVLMIVVMSGRLSSYIADAAAGRLASGLVFPVLMARLPEYLELVLPLALFLGVMISLIQFRQSSELTVMTATGFSTARLLQAVVFCAGFVAFLVALFSFYVSPRGGQFVNSLVNSQGLQNELAVVTPGRFYSLDDEGGTIYADRISDERDLMTQVMLSRVGETDASGDTLILADRGYPFLHQNGGNYFVLEDGVRYVGQPGSAQYQVTEFERYFQLMPPREVIDGKRTREQTLFFHQLWAEADNSLRAERNWRISLPLLVIILSLVAYPMSRSMPRQGGRYARVLPGALLYVLYIVALNAAREAQVEGEGSSLTFWLIHGSFFALALIMLSLPWIRLRMLK